MATKLSANFTLEELCKSQTASRLGINNMPRGQNKDKIIANLRRVCKVVLQPVRDHYGVPFSPSSGYRSPKLNKAIGSKSTSQHIKGEAVDFEVPGVPNAELADWVEKNVKFDQLILEFHKPSDPSSGWVHCSVKASGNRNKRFSIG